MQNETLLKPAASNQIGIEDKFYYTISSECASCGVCVSNCPVHAINEQDGVFQIDAAHCIDCGTCSSVCPTGSAHRTPYKRSSIAIESIDKDKCYFNPGCALNLYKKDAADAMLDMLRDHFENIKLHSICCRHEPKLPAGSLIWKTLISYQHIKFRRKRNKNTYPHLLHCLNLFPSAEKHEQRR